MIKDFNSGVDESNAATSNLGIPVMADGRLGGEGGIGDGGGFR